MGAGGLNRVQSGGLCLSLENADGSAARFAAGWDQRPMRQGFGDIASVDCGRSQNVGFDEMNLYQQVVCW